MTNGNVCNSITKRKDCETAAKVLGLSDTTAQDVPSNEGNDGPSSCYYKPGNPDDSKLFFNPTLASTASCSNESNCLCKSGKIVLITGEHQLLPVG